MIDNSYDEYLEGELTWQQEEGEVAAMAVAKRERMIESEKENVEKKPFLDIQWEAKKFRQDILREGTELELLKTNLEHYPYFRAWNTSRE